MKVKSEREAAQSCPTLSDPMDYSLPGSSIHGIFQARELEWSAIAFSMSSLHQIAIFHWLSVLDIIMCMFPYFSLISSHFLREFFF